MPTFITAVYEGKQYLWDGKRWYEENTHIEPPTCISSKLHALSAVRIAADRDIVMNLEKQLDNTKNAQKRRQLQRTLQVVQLVRNKSKVQRGIAAAL